MLKNVHFTRLKIDFLKIGINIDDNWKGKSDKLNKSSWFNLFETFIIKNSALRSWYSLT